MWEKGFQSINSVLQDQCKVSGLFYDPLTQENSKNLMKEIGGIQSRGVFSNVLSFHDRRFSNTLSEPQNHQQFSVRNQKFHDKNLHKIIQNSKINSHSNRIQESNEKSENISFSRDEKQAYNQTPDFKCLLQTPLKTFIKKYKREIQFLANSKKIFQKYQQIPKDQNPLLLQDDPAAYFVGIAIGLQNQNLIYEPLFFYLLACYVEPFNQQAWRELIQFCKRVGRWKNAFQYSKTAFLFCQSSQFAESYYLCGDRIQTPAHQMRGLLSSLKNPQKFEKVLTEGAKYQIKYRKMWRGLCLLNEYSKIDFEKEKEKDKGPFSPAINHLAKCLESLGFAQISLQILVKMLQRGTNKLPSCKLFIEIILRNKLVLGQEDYSNIQYYIEKLPAEVRYRICLTLAEYFLRKSNFTMVQYYLQNSFNFVKFFNRNAGADRAYREIYFTVAQYQILYPLDKLAKFYETDEYLIFMINRKRFINGQKLIKHEFRNWKFYLHYGLEKNIQLLLQVYEESKQARIIAEAIHFLRQSKEPLAMLKYWRSHIEDSLKSGQLWCQGGRIYADLGEKYNAIKCFKFAIHFTPQFGDSFLELLKIYLQDSNYLEANQLRKNFEASQPFYGNAFCFLQSNYNSYCTVKLSLRQVWEKSKQQIKSYLYNKNNDGKPQLTASQAYNDAITNYEGAHNSLLRKSLFTSYEQIDSALIKL